MHKTLKRSQLKHTQAACKPLQAACVNEFGIKDVCLSVPCEVSDKGVNRMIQGPLSSEELASLSHSANILKKSIDSL